MKIKFLFTTIVAIIFLFASSVNAQTHVKKVEESTETVKEAGEWLFEKTGAVAGGAIGESEKGATIGKAVGKQAMESSEIVGKAIGTSIVKEDTPEETQRKANKNIEEGMKSDAYKKYIEKNKDKYK